MLLLVRTWCTYVPTISPSPQLFFSLAHVPLGVGVDVETARGVGSGEVHGGARVYRFLFLYVEAGMNEGFFPSNWWSVNLIRTGITMRDRDKEIDAWESLGVFLSCFLIFFLLGRGFTCGGWDREFILLLCRASWCGGFEPFSVR